MNTSVLEDIRSLGISVDIRSSFHKVNLIYCIFFEETVCISDPTWLQKITSIVDTRTSMPLVY